jgi:phosphohistidine phosphatase
MNLYLLRHGLAIERGTGGYKNDAERPLTGKGRRRLQREAAALRKMGCSFDLILSSPLVRARATAEVVAEVLRVGNGFKLSALLSPKADRAELIRYLKKLKPRPKDLLLIGHEPDLSLLASLLLTGGDQLELTLKKGGLCKLNAPTLRAGKCASLEWLLRPSHLERMA